MMLQDPTVTPKFNPYMNLDGENQLQDSIRLFKHMETETIIHPNSDSSLDNSSESLVDQVVEFSQKKQAEIGVTTKNVGNGQLAKIIVSSPASSHEEASYENGSDEEIYQKMLRDEAEEGSFESSELFVLSEVESKKKIKLPKARRIRSDSTHNRGQNIAPQRQKKIKKDQRKNMYGYSFKFIVKDFLSEKYSIQFQKLCSRFGVTDAQDVRDFYLKTLKWSISLKDLYSLLNFNEHSVGDPLRAVKQAFHSFYVHFMRKRYTLHILQQEKILHKDPYLKAKNYLIYLPKIRTKQKMTRSNRSSKK